MGRFRESSSRGGWSDLGLISKSRNFSYPFGVVGPLPKGVKYVSLRLCHVSPSITAIVACFSLDDEAARRPIKLMSRGLESKFVSHGRSYSISGPISQKGDLIEQNRIAIRKELSRWFGKHVPGLFSTSQSDKFPTCELLMLDGKNLNTSSKSEILRILGLRMPFNTWGSEDWPGVEFVWPLPGRLEPEWHAVLAAHRGPLQAIDTKSYGGGRDVYQYKFQYRIVPFLLLWAMRATVEDFQARISRIRDDELGFKIDNADNALDSLQKMTLESADVASISSDLQDMEKVNGMFYAEMAQFSTTRGHKEKQKLFLGEALKKYIEHISNELSKMDTNLKALAVQRGNLLATKQNINLQKWVGRLTVVTVILAVVSVILAGISAVEPAENLLSQYVRSPSQ